MLSKLKEMLNPSKWLEGVIIQKTVAKGIKYGVAVVIGIGGSPFFVAKVKPIVDFGLKAFDMTVTSDQVQKGVTVLLTAAVGAAMNYIKRRKDVIDGKAA